MLSSQARVATDQPQRYVKQLVNHLGHRLSTHLADDGEGLVEVDGGRCVLSPQADALVLSVDADDEATMSRLQDVVGSHLERFGARAGLRVEWSAVSGTPH